MHTYSFSAKPQPTLSSPINTTIDESMPGVVLKGKFVFQK